MTTIADVAAERRHRLQARVTALRGRHAWLDHLSRTSDRYFEQRGKHFAAAMTFFTLLVLVPLLAVTFAVAGYLLFLFPALIDDLRREIAASLPPGLAEALQPIVASAIEQRNTTAAIGMLGAAWSGVWWMANLREAVSAQWGLPAVKPTSVRRYATDLVALLGLGGALFGSFALSAVANGVVQDVLAFLGLGESWLTSSLLRAAAVVVSLGTDWLIFLFAMTRLPRTPVPARGPAARAAVIGAVGLEALKYGIGFYLVNVATTSAGGAIFGSVFGVMLFVYVLSRFSLLLTAWAATAVDAEPPSPVPVPARLVEVPAAERPHRTSVLVAAGAAGLALGLWLRGSGVRRHR